MINIPQLTPEVLAMLSEQMGGCDFSNGDQRRFLESRESCHVQAAPGHGKTTLLVAKLALLSSTWRSQTEGVCVISHTNAAREEVERELGRHPLGAKFLSYPHFIGTVTTFIDRYIALPYLRGLGWTVARIDDDVFQNVAKSRWRAKPPLVRYARNNSSLEREYVPKLTISPDFHPEPRPTRLSIRHRYRQPRPPGVTGVALEELKAEIVNEGFYRFADLTAIAVQAIAKCPRVSDRLRSRFPLVLLDEAQDTSGEQLALLETVFGEEVAFQRLGDQNQTLYEDEEGTDQGELWVGDDESIPLDQTRRFGAGIATFASRLTARVPQQIVSTQAGPEQRVLILFDEESIESVLPKYAQEVRLHWGEGFRTELDIRAVASRHNPASGRNPWPKTLIDYHPQYRSGNGPRARTDTLCGAIRQAGLLYHRGGSPLEVMDLISASLAGLLRRQNWQGRGMAPESRNLWRSLVAEDERLTQELRRTLWACVKHNAAAWHEGAWEAFTAELTGLLSIREVLTESASSYLDFVAEGHVDGAAGGQTQPRDLFEQDGVTVTLGSIHSVKGKTVDAILVVETEVWRGPSHGDHVMDLETVLPHAFGLVERNFTANRAELAAATNIYVAVTRPRRFLACAVRKNAVNDELVTTAQEQGWRIRDLTVEDIQ